MADHTVRRTARYDDRDTGPYGSVTVTVDRTVWCPCRCTARYGDRDGGPHNAVITAPERMGR